MGDNKEFHKLVDLVHRRLRDEEDENDPELRVSLRETQSQEERCAVCRDGPDGLVVCRGCGTLLHATCLIDVRGCPTMGCGEKDPLQPTPTRYHEDWNVVEHLVSQPTDIVDSKKEPPCKHKFNPMDNRCDYCRETLEAHAAKEFGSTQLPHSDPRRYPITTGDMRAANVLSEADEMVTCERHGCGEPTARCLVYCVLCHADDDCGDGRCSHNNQIFAHQKRVNEQRLRARTSKRHREAFYAATLFVAFLLGLLHTILTSTGYIPS